jgi:hypothetical protein
MHSYWQTLIVCQTISQRDAGAPEGRRLKICVSSDTFVYAETQRIDPVISGNDFKSWIIIWHGICSLHKDCEKRLN